MAELETAENPAGQPLPHTTIVPLAGSDRHVSCELAWAAQLPLLLELFAYQPAGHALPHTEILPLLGTCAHVSATPSIWQAPLALELVIYHPAGQALPHATMLPPAPLGTAVQLSDRFPWAGQLPFVVELDVA